MEVQFDHGTILLKLNSDDRNNKSLESILIKSKYWKWDTRILQFRAPAWHLYSFLAALKSLQIPYYETITAKHNPLSINILPLELRSYQLEAYTQWQQKGCRGVVILPTGAGKTRVALHAIQSIRAKPLYLFLLEFFFTNGKKNSKKN